MNSKRVLRLRKSILDINTQILKYKDKVDLSFEENTKYNRLLIRKAIAKKEITERNQSFIKKLITRLTARKQEKLICDYFKS